jgi:transcriptional regulator with XRE-family HTH domain
VKKTADPDRQKVWAARRLALGRRIRALRIAKGLTQESLALESGVSRNMLIGIEHGTRGVLAERLGDIADVLEIDPAELLKTPDKQ